MAVVYRAVGPEAGAVALKVLFPPPGAETELRLRFEREARTAARLRHPGIVPVLDTGQADGYAYLAMPFIEGQTLAERLTELLPLGLDEATAADIAWQVADALDYAHRQGIVHRDVKPSNILLTSGGRAMLADFGVAQALDDPALTRTGHAVGTPAYMAPEQVSGDQAVDGRADLYALGVVLYQMVTGRTPFRGSTPHVLHAHLYEPPPPPSSVAQVSPAMEATIIRAMAKEVKERFQTGAAMAQVLANLEEQTGTQFQAIPPVKAPKARFQYRWLWFVPVMLLGIVGLWQWNGSLFAGPGVVSSPSPTPVFTGTARLSTSIALVSPTPSPTATATLSPTPTAAPSPSASATPTPVPSTPTSEPATPTPIPPPVTEQSPPAETLTPTPTASPTPCPQAVAPAFAPFLAEASLSQRLGCPQGETISTPTAWQRFERGHLLWRQDLNLIYILEPDGDWAFTGDTWRDGDIEPPSEAPDGLYQPVRGFGRVWRERPGIRDALGWATGEEQGFVSTLQEFDGGLLWHAPEQEAVFMLFKDGTYRVEE
jgi:serine/threonine-protein kinase